MRKNSTYPSYSCDVTDFGRTHFGHYTNPTTKTMAIGRIKSLAFRKNSLLYLK